MSKSVAKLESLEDSEDYEEKPTVNILYDQSSNETNSRFSDDEKKPVIDDQSSQSDDSESKDCVDSVDELPIDIPNPEDAPVNLESWPTIQILPGGLIKNEDSTESTKKNLSDSLYACAKCPEKFNDILHLTKHIRAHDDAKKRGQGVEWNRLSMLEKQLIDLKRSRLELDKKYYKQKVAITSRISKAMMEIGSLDDFLL